MGNVLKMTFTSIVQNVGPWTKIGLNLGLTIFYLDLYGIMFKNIKYYLFYNFAWRLNLILSDLDLFICFFAEATSMKLFPCAQFWKPLLFLTFIFLPLNCVSIVLSERLRAIMALFFSLKKIYIFLWGLITLESFILYLCWRQKQRNIYRLYLLIL